MFGKRQLANHNDMKNVPEKIHLNLGTDVEPDDDFSELNENGDITWCADRIWDTDIEYIRLDIVEAILHEVASRWGSDYGGSTVGVLGRQAKEIIEKHGTE